MAEHLHEDLLIKYLDDEMTPADKEIFEKLLETDAGLRDRLERLRVAKDAIRYYGIQQRVAEVRGLWEQSGTTKDEPAGGKIIFMRKVLPYSLLAASIIIIIIGVKSFFMTSLTPDQIYQQTYTGYSLGDVRSEAITRTPLEKAYQENNYREVTALGRQTSISAKEQLLVGISYLQLNDPASAITYFETLQTSADSTYHQDAEFYLGLAYLKKKEYTKSLQLLKKIQNDPNHLYHNQVSEKTIKEIERLQ